MSNGALFDLYVLAAAACTAGSFWLFLHLRPSQDRPVDWEKDYPEFRRAKDAHVKIVP